MLAYELAVPWLEETELTAHAISGVPENKNDMRIVAKVVQSMCRAGAVVKKYFSKFTNTGPFPD